MELRQVIKKSFAYFLGILYVGVVSGFFGIYFVGWAIPNIFFNVNTRLFMIFGIILTAIFAVGMWVLFVGEMVEDWADDY